MQTGDISLIRTVSCDNRSMTIIDIADYVSLFCCLAGSETVGTFHVQLSSVLPIVVTVVMMMTINNCVLLMSASV
jgi:hypothetical protein